MKLKYVYFYTLPLLVGLFLFSAFSSNNAPTGLKGNKGIIKFSHKFHKDVAECTDCHSAVPKSTSLNDNLMPTHNDCANCHDVTDKKKCDNCHYANVKKTLIQSRANIVFNHSFHLGKEKLKCDFCHKGINNVKYAEDAIQPVPVMGNCYTCHNTSKGPGQNACESCHISTAKLMPQSHKNSSWIQNHKFAARSFNANCVMCHDNASCQDCHTGTTMITEENTADDFYRPYSPTNSTDGARLQQVTRVHSLGYRFTHGIDAEGKTAECTTCHQIDTFCAKCHQSRNADFSLGGIEPISHLKPDFMIIGVGSGGGEHAVLARRDIESCAACHDVQGGDPVCIKCHVDPDGIQGTNPKTHPANYMRNVHGDWHSSDGSICFNCHTNTHQAGVGFCGYCHGSNVH